MLDRGTVGWCALDVKRINRAGVWTQSHITPQDTKQDNVTLAFHLVLLAGAYIRCASYAVLDQTLILSSYGRPTQVAYVI
jgi:hypothetical protein